jgi:hypothetical protein
VTRPVKELSSREGLRRWSTIYTVPHTTINVHSLYVPFWLHGVVGADLRPEIFAKRTVSCVVKKKEKEQQRELLIHVVASQTTCINEQFQNLGTCFSRLTHKAALTSRRSAWKHPQCTQDSGGGRRSPSQLYGSISCSFDRRKQTHVMMC